MSTVEKTKIKKKNPKRPIFKHVRKNISISALVIALKYLLEEMMARPGNVVQIYFKFFVRFENIFLYTKYILIEGYNSVEC